MKAVEVKRGVVVDTLVATAEVAAERGWVSCDDAVAIGWTYPDGVFSAPVVEQPIPPVPPSVSQAQLRIALHRRGLLATVQAMVDAAGDPEVSIRWGAPTMERHSPLLITMATLPPLALTEAEIDQIFREAAAL